MKLPRLKLAAIQDAIKAAEQFALQNPALGDAFKLALRRAWEEIARSPHRFAKLETNETDRDIRRAILWRFKYLVVYEIENDQPIVLAVIHASREPNAWRKGDSYG